jgi:RES domain-containing protein
MPRASASELGRFPRRTLRGDRTIYRLHRSASGAWWFSSDGTGRFDPVGTDRGACYLAEQPLGAWIEVFRKRMLLSEAEIAERSLFTVVIGRDLRLADLTSRRALQFGVTASLGADEDYDPSQAFAAAAVDAGFAGIRYHVRHDPAQRLHGIALFGAPGADPDWPAGDDIPIPDELRAEAQATFGYRVIPSPSI